jgi:hypothetical protein
VSSEPPTKRPRLENTTSNTARVVEVEDEYEALPDNSQGHNETFESEDDPLELTAQRWQASEELSALLDVCFAKPISRFDKRQLIKSCPRPNVDCVYTPVLDHFLADLVTKCKVDDKALRKTEDLLLDVTGPIAMCYEMVLQGQEHPANLDLSAIMGCLTKSFQLLGNVNDHIRNKRRAQVLSKIGQRYIHVPI